MRFQRRLAQLAPGDRSREGCQCKQGNRDEPHPSSQFLVGPASVALEKLICNENNRIRETLHTTSRNLPITLPDRRDFLGSRLLGLLLELQRPHLGVGAVSFEQFPV